MTHATGPANGLRRRAILSLPAACLASGIAACSQEVDAPEGWVRMEKGQLSVAVPPEWHEVAIPEDAAVSSWDWAIQDTEDFNDAETSVRLLAMTQGPSAVIMSPLSDTAEAAETLGSLDLFGQGDRIYPEAQEIESGEDEVQRVDMPYGDGAGTDYLLVAKDEESALMVVVGITGPGVTEDIIAGIAAGIRVIAPAG